MEFSFLTFYFFNHTGILSAGLLPSAQGKIGEVEELGMVFKHEM